MSAQSTEGYHASDSRSVTYFRVFRRRKASLLFFSAVQNDAIGPKRHFAAARQFGRFRTDADIGLDFMSTRPSTTLAGLRCLYFTAACRRRRRSPRGRRSKIHHTVRRGGRAPPISLRRSRRGSRQGTQAYALPQTNTAAEETAKQLNGHAQTPPSGTEPAPAEAKHDTQPPKQTSVANAQGRPTALSPDFANIPEELKALPNWFLWRYLPPKSQGQKWRKVPFQTNGKPASSTDPTTWSSFEECCAAYARGGFDGVGFAFDGKVGPDGRCYVGVDFDHCIDENGKLHPLVRSRIKQLNTYTEASVTPLFLTATRSSKTVVALPRLMNFTVVLARPGAVSVTAMSSSATFQADWRKER